MSEEKKIITPEKVKYIGELARIGLTNDESEEYSGQMNSILDYMKILDEVDISNVEPTTQVTGLTGVMREDEVKFFADVDKLLKCSPLPKMAHQIAVQSVIKEE